MTPDKKNRRESVIGNVITPEVLVEAQKEGKLCEDRAALYSAFALALTIYGNNTCNRVIGFSIAWDDGTTLVIPRPDTGSKADDLRFDEHRAELGLSLAEASAHLLGTVPKVMQ